MASVFLSYDREDAAIAGSVARALERAGHSVWWDLHIKGGAEYGREIEAALEQSAAVVVLWSEYSVASPWVRDEAAAGRDGGRLIPVLIRSVTPPMGFRQYQNIDFSGWKGRGKPPRLTELLTAIDGLSKPALKPGDPAPVRAPVGAAKSRDSRWWVIGGALILALLILGSIIGMVLGNKSRGEQTVVVTAADTAAQPMARDLLVKLSELQGAKSGTMRLLSQENTSDNADFIFELAGGADPTRTGADLVLMAGKDREILWSKSFEQPSRNIADLKQQVAYTAARVLNCTLEGLSSGRRSLDRQTLKLYLNACAQLTEGAASAADPRVMIATFEQLTKKAPDFAPAWSGLLLAQTEATTYFNVGSSGDPASIRALKQRIEDARKLHPDLPEIRIAEISLMPSYDHSGRMRLIDEAKRASPENSVVLTNRSDMLRAVGRNSESIEDAQHALAIEPLSPFMYGTYISALSYSGRIDAAREQLAKAERFWPGTAALQDMQYRFHLRFGDPNEAKRLGNTFGPGRGLDLFLKARIERTPANIQAMKDYSMKRVPGDVGALSFVAQAFGEFQLNEELYRIVLAWRPGNALSQISDVWFRPALEGFRHDPRFMQVMQRTGHLDYWRKSGKWPDFCRNPDLPYDCKTEAAKLP